jgi:hypothetical protein
MMDLLKYWFAGIGFLAVATVALSQKRDSPFVPSDMTNLWDMGS